MYENDYFESYDIDISHIKDNDKVCWQYTTDPPLDDEEWVQAEGEIYYKLDPKTQALALASDYVHIEKIKPSNIMEWYYRLDSLFDIGIGFIHTETPEGEIPIRCNLRDLTDHLGLRVRTSPWDNHKFDRYIRQLRMKNNLRSLL